MVSDFPQQFNLWLQTFSGLDLQAVVVQNKSGPGADVPFQPKGNLKALGPLLAPGQNGPCAAAALRSHRRRLPSCPAELRSGH